MTPSTAESPDESRPGESTFVTVEGARLHCLSAGVGPPLVFVHAGIADSRLWDRQVEAFADRFWVLAYDLRGFGESELPPGSYAHYRDLAGVLDAFDVDAAHLVGASMGGAAVLDFALAHPDRVVSCTLVAPGIGGYEITDAATEDGWAAVSEAFEAGDFERAAAVESDMWLAGPERTLDEVDPGQRELVESMLRRSYELDADAATEEWLDPPAIDRLDEISVPVLVVAGDLDRPDITAGVQILERDLSDVRVEVFDDVAHLPSLERPDEFDAVLGSFLERVAAER